jgi:DNA polymerase-3 subunit alpha
MGKIEELVPRAKELGMDALAITDHGAMYGVVEFYEAAQKHGIKPIVGCEVYVAPQGRFQRGQGGPKVRPYHLVLLAKDATGYQNLIQLSTKAYLEGFYYKPRVDKELLRQHSAGLIALSACSSGEIPVLIQNGRMDEARDAIRWYQETFGPRNFYLELQRHTGGSPRPMDAMPLSHADQPSVPHSVRDGIDPQLEAINQALITLGRELNVGLVATNDVHYIQREDAAAHEVLLCIQTGTTMDDPNHMRMGGDDFYLKSEQEMATLFADIPEALENTKCIVAECALELKNEGFHLPYFEVPEGHTAQSYLASLCEEGMRRRYPLITADLRTRLEHELRIIHEMDFDVYFLIVWDLVRFAQSQDIWWNVRGSAAGSIVAYSLGLTTLEPLRHGLIFERFLNPGRVNMPDIDLDFPDDRRNEVIEYVIGKYGSDRVAQIITFARMAARASLRDVGRALGLPLGEVDRLAKLVPFGPKVKLQDALETSQELQSAYEQDDYIRDLIDKARRLEGVARNVSTHAAGVVIADKSLNEYLPLQRIPRGEEIVTQYAMGVLEQIGLLKIDLLGLSTLTIMRRATDLINERHGTAFRLDNIPTDDPAVYELLSTGNVTGLFQVEGSGMRRVLQDLQPSGFDDVVALLSLYRPGPMQFIDSFVARKYGREKVEHIHPSLEPILRDTYGIIVYQEQIIRIATDIAGYSSAEADLMRRAVGKKKEKELKEQRDKFVDGAVARGMPRDKAEEIFSAIEYFANYGFNKAHSAAYAVITCQTAYLKAYYPVEYMTALLSVERHRPEKVSVLVAECRRHGIPILPPAVNCSQLDFTIENLSRTERGTEDQPRTDGDARTPAHSPNGGRKLLTGEHQSVGSASPDTGRDSAIRFGLGAIKNLGEGAVQLILQARGQLGPFTGIGDFCRRVDLGQVNKRGLECLIKAGTLDALGERPKLLAMIDRMMKLSTLYHQASAVGQLAFDALAPSASDDSGLLADQFFVPPVSQKDVLAWEKELLGTYVSDHPLQRLLSAWDGQQTRLCTPLDQIDDGLKGHKVVIAGMVTRSRLTMTRKNEEMAFVELEDLSGSIDVVVFPRTFSSSKELLVEDQLLVIEGRIDVREGKVQVIADSVQDYALADIGLAAGDGQSLAAGDGQSLAAGDGQSPATGGGHHPAAGGGHSPAAGGGVGKAITSPRVRLLEINLHCSGDRDHDVQLMKKVYQMLEQRPGPDRFLFNIISDKGRVQLDFPNATTHFEPGLESVLRTALGDDALYVQWTEA